MAGEAVSKGCFVSHHPSVFSFPSPSPLLLAEPFSRLLELADHFPSLQSLARGQECSGEAHEKSRRNMLLQFRARRAVSWGPVTLPGV